MALGKYSLMYHVSVRPFFGRVKSPGFSFLYAKPRKEARFVKNWLLLNIRASSKLLDLILLTSVKRLHITSCLK